MAKYSRLDGRKPWGCGSTTCIIAFLALSLIGVWMLLINSIVPENPNPSIQEVNHMKDLTKEEENDENLQEEFVKERSYKNTKSEKEMKEVSGNDGDGKRDGWESSRLDEDLNSQGEGKETVRSEEDGNEQNQTEQKFVESKPIIEEKSGEIKPEDNRVILTEDEKVDLNQDKYSEKFLTKNAENQDMNQASTEEFIFGKESETVSRDTDEQAAWLSQTVKSKNEKESQQSLLSEYEWKLCKTTAGPDYIPCLDNWQVIRKLPSTGHYEHRERHCPDEAPTCLVPMPWGYKRPIRWPESRNRIWFHNAPHTKLGEVKGHQNWVKVNGDYLTFPGGGTQFKNGALHYIDFIQKSLPRIAWGKRTRVVLDIGCGVASFGGFLFDRGVLTMSIAPKDEHEAQVQFAIERGIPAILGVMGTKRLPFPGTVFDVVHCARCRVPWHIEGGKLLLELNRVLRPGGYFVWSATPVYQKLPEDVGIWKAMSRLTKSMCWDLITIKRDRVNAVAAAIYRKPTSNECYKQRTQKEPPLCKESDDLNKAWNVSLRACMHKVAVDASEQGSSWPEQWPLRLQKPPKWLNSHVGVYGKTSPGDFTAEYRHWNNVFSQSYLDGMGIDWSFVRNVMDMRAVYGGFAAALADLKVWVMNVVPIDSPNTLPIIYERGLLGIYHDWCESFNTYPRSYDLLHADRLFSRLKKRCNIMAVIAEVDRILRPEGILIIWDDMETVNLLENLAKSLKWEIRLSISKDKEGLLCLKKKFWRPTVPELIAAANVQA